MTRSTAYGYKAVITTEDECTVSIEFDSTDELSREEQEERAEQILSAVRDGIETGTVDVELKPVEHLIIETTTYTTKL